MVIGIAHNGLQCYPLILTEHAIGHGCRDHGEGIDLALARINGAACAAALGHVFLEALADNRRKKTIQLEFEREDIYSAFFGGAIVNVENGLPDARPVSKKKTDGVP